MNELADFLERIAGAMAVVVWAKIAALAALFFIAAPVLLLPFGTLVALWWAQRPRC